MEKGHNKYRKEPKLDPPTKYVVYCFTCLCLIGEYQTNPLIDLMENIAMTERICTHQKLFKERHQIELVNKTSRRSTESFNKEGHCEITVM